MHEIITLQLGQRSNYLATHFWNTQESYFTYSQEQESIVDHDIHFRPGIGADGTETFTPRTVIYDLKGGFGSLRKLNALYEIDEPAAPEALWNGPTVVQRQATIQQSDYVKSLDEGLEPPRLTTESVRYWSDFNRVYFHPRSIVQLNEYDLNSTLMPFENWDAGEELFKSLDKEHDLLDRDLRPFAEEADQMQGIQLLAGVDDAWGGFAARYMDRLRDEYGKTTIWFWGLEDDIKTAPRAKKILKISNTARTISEIASQASLFIPMTVPSATRLPSYVDINPQSQWHVSGLLSAALESMTLPSRLKAQKMSLQTLDQLEHALNINGRQNIAKLRMGIEQKSDLDSLKPAGKLAARAQSRDTRLPSQERSSDEPRTTDEEGLTVFDVDFFPTDELQQSRGRGSSKKTHVFGQTEHYRGDEDPKDEGVRDEDEGYKRTRQRAAGLPLIHKSRTRLPFPILNSFPSIFHHTGSAASISVNTSLSTDTTVALRLKSLGSIVSRSFDIAEREALSNSLGELAEAYEEGWDSGSDEDDD